MELNIDELGLLLNLLERELFINSDIKIKLMDKIYREIPKVETKFINSGKFRVFEDDGEINIIPIQYGRYLVKLLEQFKDKEVEITINEVIK